MYKYKFALVSLILSLIFPVLSAYADTYPKREIRAAWVTPVNGDWPDDGVENGTTDAKITAQKNHAIAIIKEMKAKGFNAIFVHARPYSDRMYLEKSYTHNGSTYTVYEPFSHFVSGTRGTEVSYDPLEFWVTECHNQGMECHAWINPLRFCNVTGDVTKPSSDYSTLPIDQAVWDNGWIIYKYQGTDNNITKFCFDPSVSGVRARINNACIVIAGNYDVDGIVWDDYFYPDGIPEDSTAGDYERYQSYLSGGGTLSMGDWRRENCNTMIREAYKSIKSIKPYIKFGLAPAGAGGGNPKYCAFTEEEKATIPVLNGTIDIDVTWSDWQYNTIYADLIAWLREGIIDYISPQLYWSTEHATNPFGPMCQWWQDVSNYFNRHCYPSNGFGYGTTYNGSLQADWDDVVSQIEITRNTAQTNAPGSIVYPARFFDLQSSYYYSGMASNTLYNNVYQKRAIVPATDWYETTNPGKPKKLKLSSDTLTWDAATMSDGTVSGIGMRYAVYAIPLNVGRVDASSDVHTKDGGFKAEYLLDLTYSNTYNVSNYSSSNYWYAVTIVDRYGNEWEASAINEPTLGDASISLNEPADNSTLTFSDNTFSWTSDGETFIFQISTSSDFSTILSEQETTAKSITISAENFTDGATYYWRVKASRASYNSAWSETRTFTMETRPTITLTLLTPAKGSTIDSETISFSWNGIDGANYTFELAEYSSFNNILITTTTTDTNYEIATSSLTGNKTYFWRIKATKDTYQSAVSEYSSFITPTAEGETVDGITIEELWLKSVADTELSSCTNPRSMAAYQGNVYVLERTSATNCSLLFFDGDTGEYIKTIALTGDCYTTSSGSALSYPCNSIYIDGGGNLCVANMTTSTKTQPLTVCTVTISGETAVTTRVFESSLTTTGYRIDYSNAFGDITADGGQIWAATTSDKVFRWTRTSSGWTMEETTVSDFYPTTATSFGSAPSIQPISDNQFIVDGAGTHPTLYTFNSGSSATLNSSFESNKSIEPKSCNFNGTCSITIGNTPLFIYANNNNHSFSIVANKENFDFSQFQFMQSVPENQFGSNNNPFYLDQPVAINNTDGSVTVFLYAPKNGLAAYKLRLPPFASPELYAPADGKVINSDISFVASQVTTTENQYLEIATDASFSEESIVVRYNDGVLTKAELTGRPWYQYTVPVSILKNSYYYWRVRAVDPDGLLSDGFSETRIIYVLNDQDNYTDSYNMAREEDPDYGIKNNVRLTNNWIRSTTYGNDIAIGTGTASRGFCVRPDVNGDQGGKDIIYITYRDGSNASFKRYDAATGEQLSDLAITTTTGTTLSTNYPNNGVFLDDELNLCIYNLCDASTDKSKILQLCTVDTDGNATEAFSIELTERIDHVRAIGDVIGKNFILFGAVSASGKVYRWTISGSNITTETMTATSFYPNADFGNNIMIYPVDDTYFFIDGSATYFALYNFDTGEMAGNFSSLTALSPTRANTCGGNYFTHNGRIYIIYPKKGYLSPSTSSTITRESYQFNIVSLNSFENFTGATLHDSIPQDVNALPATNQGGWTWSALADYLPKKKASEELQTLASTELQTRSINNSNTTILYTYVPGSGLASYSMTNHIVTGAEETEVNPTPEITVKDGTIYLGTTVTEATLYSVSGQAIARVTEAVEMYAPAQGVYILATDIDGIITSHKIIIK